MFDSRTLQSSPESDGGGRAGYDGAKRRKGSKAHRAVDTLGHLLAPHVTAPDGQDRARWRSWPRTCGPRRATRSSWRERPTAADAGAHGIALSVVRLPEAKRGFVLLLPRRWVAERSSAWAAPFRRLARGYERLAATLAGLHAVAFACVMLRSLTSRST